MDEFFNRISCAALDRIEREEGNITPGTINLVKEIGYTLTLYRARSNKERPKDVRRLVAWLAAYISLRVKEESEQEPGLSTTTTELLQLLRTNFRCFL